MRKGYALALALILGACGGQPAADNKQLSASEQAHYVLCGEAMDLTAEQVLQNLDAGLRRIKASPAVNDKKIEKIECGFRITMDMDFGMVRLELDEYQKVRNLGVAYENVVGTDDALLKNFENSTAAMQAVLSVNGSEPFGQTEIGKDLMRNFSELLREHKSVGEGMRDIDFEGNLYTVAVDGRAVGFVVRKGM